MYVLVIQFVVIAVTQGVNSVELAMDAVTYIQKKFYQDYPPHPSEQDYLFATPSTMKPTQIKVSCLIICVGFGLLMKV